MFQSLLSGPSLTLYKVVRRLCSLALLSSVSNESYAQDAIVTISPIKAATITEIVSQRHHIVIGS